MKKEVVEERRKRWLKREERREFREDQNKREGFVLFSNMNKISALQPFYHYQSPKFSFKQSTHTHKIQNV